MLEAGGLPNSKPCKVHPIQIRLIGEFVMNINHARSESTLDRAREIARAEMMRRRRRLGNLTQEQESAIETLLLSTVLKASRMIEPVLKFYSQPPSLVGAPEPGLN